MMLQHRLARVARLATATRRRLGFVDHTERGVLARAARHRARPSPAPAWLASAPLVGRGLDDPAVAHDRDLVGGRDDLGELVADERDGLALVVDHACAARRTRTADLGRRQHRCRLVEHEDLRVAAQALDDLDPLAHAGGEVGDAVVGIDLAARTAR